MNMMIKMMMMLCKIAANEIQKRFSIKWMVVSRALVHDIWALLLVYHFGWNDSVFVCLMCRSKLLNYLAAARHYNHTIACLVYFELFVVEYCGFVLSGDTFWRWNEIRADLWVMIISHDISVRISVWNLRHWMRQRVYW